MERKITSTATNPNLPRRKRILPHRADSNRQPNKPANKAKLTQNERTHHNAPLAAENEANSYGKKKLDAKLDALKANQQRPEFANYKQAFETSISEMKEIERLEIERNNAKRMFSWIPDCLVYEVARDCNVGDY